MKPIGFALLSQEPRLGFIPCQFQPVINRRTRTTQDLDDLFWIVTVKEPQNQNAGNLRRIFPSAGVLADPSQVILSLNLVAQIDSTQADLGRVILNNTKLLPHVVCIATPLRQVEISY